MTNGRREASGPDRTGSAGGLGQDLPTCGLDGYNEEDRQRGRLGRRVFTLF